MYSKSITRDYVFTMAITIHSSNRVETLQTRLSQQLATNPLADPFSPEVIVVPTYAMGRWLNLRIALQQGIAANIQYPQAAEWIWSLASILLRDAPKSDPCSAAALGWWIFNDLPSLLDQAGFSALHRYPYALVLSDAGTKCKHHPDRW